MREEHRVGIDYLEAVTALTQRVRSAHPTAGQFEAADFQWWWRAPRSTDDLPQLFWFDDAGRPAAAAIATAWSDGIGLDALTLPGSRPEWIAQVVERGLEHADREGFRTVDFVIDRADEVMTEVLASHGYTDMEDENYEAWIRAEERPAISPLPPEYRLMSRLDTAARAHHMAARSGPEVEQRLRQTSLYRPDLDLLVLDDDDAVAAYAMFWYDPVTETGLVEPMRTEDAHQRRGLARHLLTAGIDRLADAGTRRIKISYRPDNEPARHLYLDVGFEPVKQCAVVARAG